MKASAIHQFFQTVGAWMDWSQTVDGFRFGDPDTDVTGIAVAWKPYWSDLRRAKDLGCNLFIGHESIFREGSMDPGDESPIAEALEQPKLDWLRRSGLVVYRCHDLWDMMPGLGVMDSWARGLGLEGKPIVTEGFFRIHDVSGHTFGSLCAQIAARVRDVGQQAVLAVGDDSQPVARLALAGGGSMLTKALELGADVWLGYDDYFRQVRDGALLRDLGLPYMIVNHGALEEWGVRNLGPYLRQRFPDLPVHLLTQGCIYRVVGMGR
ncbi:MAG: Nif3-like dinuclear metal center hexameric protein [Armatimonadota bacterium]